MKFSAASALASDDSLFRALLESAPDAMVIVDTTGTILLVNSQAERVFGYPREELLGQGVEMLMPARFRSSHLAHRAGYSRDFPTREMGSHLELCGVRKNGEEFPAEISLSPLRTGHDLLISSAIRDVTEHRRMERALREKSLELERQREVTERTEAEDRMRFALENAEIGIWDLDCESGELTWSNILERQYGIPEGTFPGTFEAFRERIHPLDRARVNDIVQEAMRTGSDFQFEHRALWPDGTTRWLLGAGRVLLDANGKPRRGVGISQDVTNRHSLEAQYLQAQKMEAIGRLAGGVAHDFNNLLTCILGYCELLLGDTDDAETPGRREILEIQKAGGIAAGLTRQLLSFSRKQLVEPQSLDVNAVVGEMRPMVTRLIGEDVEVVFRLASCVPPIVADRGQLEQIVLNLAVNARDAMPNGGSLIIETADVELDEHYAGTHVGIKPGQFVALTITDSGVGMSPEIQARLFEPFFTTKDPGKGTGLGLATVHGIVGRFGGSIHVYSEIGRGTAFTVYFPHDGTGFTRVPVTSDPARSPSQATVLIVDDSEGVRTIASVMLQRQGYQTHTAGNADEAVAMFRAHPEIAVLVSDVVMPGASGPEMTIRLLEEHRHLKVVYMSGYTEDAISKHGVLNPGVAFLHKPFTAETLVRKVREALDQRANQ